MPRRKGPKKEFRFLYRNNGGYVYFRSPIDGKLTPFTAKEGTPEFAREYAPLLRAVERLRAKPDKKKGDATPPVAIDPTKRVAAYAPGTIGRGLLVYFASNKYKTKTKGTTKINYQRNADCMRDIIGHALLKEFDIDRVDGYSEQIAVDHGPSVADAHVSLLSLVWQSCRKYAEFGIKQLVNPTDGAESHYEVKRPHLPWTDAQQTFFMQTAPGYLALAKTLQHFLGQRGGDAIRIRWDDYDGAGIWVRPEKTDRVPDPLPNYHKCPKPLLVALEKAPRVADTILVNSKGRPWRTANNLSRAMRDQLEKVGLWKKGQRNPVLHGLRKNMASELAETGASSAQIKATGGWKSNEMADYYAKHASQVAMNQMAVERWDEALTKKKKLRVVK